MELKVINLKYGVIKLSLAGHSFLIDTQKKIKEITKIDDMTGDGLLIIECTTDTFDSPVVQWINLKPYLQSIHRDDILENYQYISNYVFVN